MSCACVVAIIQNCMNFPVSSVLWSLIVLWRVDGPRGSSRRLGASRHAEGVLEIVVQDELHGDDQAHVYETGLQPAREARRAQLLHGASDATVRAAARVHLREDRVAGLRCERREHCGGGLDGRAQ